VLLVVFGSGATTRFKDFLESRFGRLDQLPVTVTSNRAAHCLRPCPSLTQTGAWGHPILAVFDSLGNVGVPLGHMQTIAANRSTG
jgi:hypothetical protein